jgi:transcriptional regulator
MVNLENTLNNLITNNFVNEEVNKLKEDLVFEPLDTSFLTPREEAVLEQREKGFTLEQVAKNFGVTRERIRQIETKAHRKIIARLRTRLAKINAEIIVDLSDEERLPQMEKDLIVQLRNKIPVLKKLLTYIESLEQLVPEHVINDSYLDQKIEVLDLSVRSYNALRRANISTLRDLAKHSVYELMKIRNLGRHSLKEIIIKAEDARLTIEGADKLFFRREL